MACPSSLLRLCCCALALSGCNAIDDGGADGGSAPAADAVQQGDVSIPRVGGAAGPDAAVDTSGGPWRIIEVPNAGSGPSIVHSPLGWLAVSSRALGDARAPSVHQSGLYRSDDGVRWERLPLDPGHDDLALGGLAHGNGRFVLSGRRGATGVFLGSEDASSWSEIGQQGDSTQRLGDVHFAGGLFFAFGFSQLGVSEDGLDWTRIPITTVQPMAAAHGAGRFVVVGSGPMQVSEDGRAWESHELPCSLPGACIQDPGGGVHQGVQGHVLFAADRFFSDQLSSADGVQWEPEPDRVPLAHADGLLIDGGGYAPNVWAPDDGAQQTLEAIRTVQASITVAGREIHQTGLLDREQPLPDIVDVSFEDGLTCESAACVIVGPRMYLIPPPGTPPLPDHVPRDALGQPLLTDECPDVSGLFCDDYGARTGCECDPTAPRGASSCQDVGQFQCEGLVEPTFHEWEVPELGLAGCDCDAVDPNQPPSFGLACEQDATVCQAPLQCLEVDAPLSYGPPSPRPRICTAPCSADEDCPRWEASGVCGGPVALSCSQGSCQPRTCD